MSDFNSKSPLERLKELQEKNAPEGGPSTPPKPTPYGYRSGYNSGRPDQRTEKPRKVRNGTKLSTNDGTVPPEWTSQRWMRTVEDNAAPETLREGLDYARMGQARAITIEPGHISARVQGRLPQSYTTQIRLPAYTRDQWTNVIESITDQPRLAAELLRGELPANIEDAFTPHQLRLFPAAASDIACACTCSDFPEAKAQLCKHVVCLMALIADRLATRPMTLFTLRGIDPEELLETIRHHRAAAALPRREDGSVPVYRAHLPGVSDTRANPIDTALDTFWSAPRSLEDLDLPITPPPVSHPLLRRLGTTPFTNARFPLVGLLATTYDLIGQAAINNTINDKPSK